VSSREAPPLDPPWLEFARPLLQVLGEGQIHRARELKAACIDRVHLPTAIGAADTDRSDRFYDYAGLDYGSWQNQGVEEASEEQEE
jgi:hypothetical protein